MLALLALWGHS